MPSNRKEPLRRPQNIFQTLPENKTATFSPDAAAPEASIVSNAGHDFSKIRIHNEETTTQSTVEDGISSPSQPLDAATLDYMEPRFGHDFSKVRIHADGKASSAAREVNATAYTTGQDIVFDSGAYMPETDRGRHLLAHELAHVVQQSRGASSTTPPLPAGPIEQAADHAASIVAQGGTVSVVGASAPGIARQPRSLQESLDPTTMSDADLAREIALIQQWLSENLASSPERDQLTGTLATMQAEAAGRNGGQSQASTLTNQVQPSASNSSVATPVLAAGMLAPATSPLWSPTPSPGSIPEGALNNWPRIPGEAPLRFPSTQAAPAPETTSVPETAAPETTGTATAETVETTEMAATETVETAATVGTTAAETAETAAVVGTTAVETAETAAVVGTVAAETTEVAAATGAVLATEAAIPVVGWIALGVTALAVGSYLGYRYLMSEDGQPSRPLTPEENNQVSSNQNNNPMQLPGQQGQNPTPAVDPTTGEPLYTPAEGDYTPVVDPVTGVPLQAPPNQSIEPVETAGKRRGDEEDDDNGRQAERRRDEARRQGRADKSIQQIDPQNIDILDNGYVEFSNGSRPAKAYSSEDEALEAFRETYPDAQIGNTREATGNNFHIAGQHIGVVAPDGVYLGTIFEGTVQDITTNEIKTVYTITFK